MKRLLFLLLPLGALAQRKEAFFDYRFRPTDQGGRYYVVTEPEGRLWKRIAYYAPEGTQAMEGTYLDSACTQAEGPVLWFHTNRRLWSRYQYVAGKRQGVGLAFYANGNLSDSTHWNQDLRQGVQLGWNEDGTPRDSSWYDGAGNGNHTGWYAGGQLRVQGRYVRDTAQDGRWAYFHENGKPWAVAEYADGKMRSCQCWDAQGGALAETDCSLQEADFPGGVRSWMTYLERNLRIPRKARPGYYTVLMRFVVQADGSLSDFQPMTSFGMGLEAEVERLLKASSRWVPARMFGKPVKAYRSQPVTFVIE